MKQFFRRLIFILAFAVVLLLTACPREESIARIQADPARYRDKEVAIVGEVTDSYGVLGTGAFQIDDGTGSLWVITKSGGLPSRGSRVGVRGRIYQGFNFGGRNFGLVLREGELRVR